MYAFGPNHYVPVLKVKPGEKAAIRRLDPTVVGRVTPLLELVERKAKPAKKKGDPDVMPTVDAHLTTAFKGLAAAVAPFERYFLDCREMQGDGAVAAQDAFSRAAALATPFTPVTSITRTVDVAPALAHRQHGVAIRLSREESEAGVITKGLPAFLAKHKLSSDEVDLIVDLGAVDQMHADGVEALASAFLADVPALTSWRTLTLSACGFPSTMGIVGKNDQAQVDRLEWKYWLEVLHAGRGSLPRLPTFSDCAVQHRDGVEGFDPRTMHASAAIRFAQDSTWLLVKGESIKLNGGAQFRGLAGNVVNGAATGVNGAHCAGCGDLLSAAGGAPKFGAPVKWREIGTIHHITLTVENLAALPWP